MAKVGFFFFAAGVCAAQNTLVTVLCGWSTLAEMAAAQKQMVALLRSHASAVLSTAETFSQQLKGTAAQLEALRGSLQE